MWCMEGLESRQLLSAWYVSLTGSDTSPGTLRQPFLTIQHAADIAQPGDTVFIRKGVYHETVTPPSSGTAAAPITFRPYKKESVTIDGADPLSGWQSGASGVYQTQAMPWDLGDGKNQLFYSGQMMNEARWPNITSGTAGLWQQTFAQAATVTPTQGRFGLAAATITVPGLSDPSGAWVGATIHIAPGQGWVFETGTVTASSPGSLTFLYTQLNPATDQTLTAGDRFYLTGKFQALDGPGEWFRDATSGVLYFQPPAGGSNLNAGQVEAKHRLYGFDLSGRSYVTINGINLFACTINTDASSTHNTIASINARYVSQQLNNADPWADKLHPHTTGIILNGAANVLQDSTIDYSSGDGVFLGGSGNTVRNTIIADTDYAGFDEAGVTTLGSNEVVSGNTIYNTGRSGVVARYSPNVSVDHNRIYNIGLLTTDLGGIYLWNTDGQGSQISYNVISDIHTGGYGGAGIYLDNSASNYIVHHNVVWNTDAALKMNPPSINNQIYNNTLVGTRALETSGDKDMSGSILVNNIFVGPADIGAGATQSRNLTDPPGQNDVQFIAPARNDYRLTRTSPAVHAGQTIPGYATSYRGTAPDLGAYPFGKKPFTAGVSKPVLRQMQLVSKLKLT